MNALLRLLRKIAVLLRRESFDRDLQEEMAFHREQAAKEFEAGGITPRKPPAMPRCGSLAMRRCSRNAAMR